MTINLPGSKLHRDLRVPFTVLQTKFHFQYQTKKAILEILLWSLDHLKNGIYPSCRHDGTAWLTTDKARSRLRGQLPARGILAEIRGDWDWPNSYFNIPVWNTASGMCWLCEAKWPESKSQTAAARSSGLSKAKFTQRVLDMGKQLCPLWGWPEMVPSLLILPDWLHVVDQGIGADIAGQLLIDLSACYPGRSLKLRVAELWKEIQILYSEHKIEYKLRALTPEILNKGKGKPANSIPTLKGPAAVIRHLIPLLPILTAKHFTAGTEHQIACDKLARFLAQAYASMEANDIKDLPKQGAKVAGQYMALENHAIRNDSTAFHIMPKIHLFQHICECGFPPKEFWTYLDETTGGQLAKLFVAGTTLARIAKTCFCAGSKLHLFHPCPLGWPEKGQRSSIFTDHAEFCVKKDCCKVCQVRTCLLHYLYKPQNQAGNQPCFEAGYQPGFEAGFRLYVENLHQPCFKAASFKSRLPA